MWIVCYADDLHEISSLIFPAKIENKYFKMSSPPVLIRIKVQIERLTFNALFG